MIWPLLFVEACFTERKGLSAGQLEPRSYPEAGGYVRRVLAER